MKQLAWLGIAYAVYLGVENWRRLEQLENQIEDIATFLQIGGAHRG